MSVHIELDCGCQINEAFVLGMCTRHVKELQQRKAQDRAEHEAYEKLLVSLPSFVKSREIYRQGVKRVRK